MGVHELRVDTQPRNINTVNSISVNTLDQSNDPVPVEPKLTGPNTLKQSYSAISSSQKSICKNKNVNWDHPEYNSDCLLKTSIYNGSNINPIVYNYYQKNNIIITARHSGSLSEHQLKLLAYETALLSFRKLRLISEQNNSHITRKDLLNDFLANISDNMNEWIKTLRVALSISIAEAREVDNCLKSSEFIPYSPTDIRYRIITMKLLFNENSYCKSYFNRCLYILRSWLYDKLRLYSAFNKGIYITLLQEYNVNNDEWITRVKESLKCHNANTIIKKINEHLVTFCDCLLTMSTILMTNKSKDIGLTSNETVFDKLLMTIDAIMLQGSINNVTGKKLNNESTNIKRQRSDSSSNVNQKQFHPDSLISSIFLKESRSFNCEALSNRTISYGSKLDVTDQDAYDMAINTLSTNIDARIAKDLFSNSVFYAYPLNLVMLGAYYYSSTIYDDSDDSKLSVYNNCSLSKILLVTIFSTNFIERNKLYFSGLSLSTIAVPILLYIWQKCTKNTLSVGTNNTEGFIVLSSCFLETVRNFLNFNSDKLKVWSSLTGLIPAENKATSSDCSAALIDNFSGTDSGETITMANKSCGKRVINTENMFVGSEVDLRTQYTLISSQFFSILAQEFCTSLARYRSIYEPSVLNIAIENFFLITDKLVTVQHTSVLPSRRSSVSLSGCLRGPTNQFDFLRYAILQNIKSIKRRCFSKGFDEYVREKHIFSGMFMDTDVVHLASEAFNFLKNAKTDVKVLTLSHLFNESANNGDRSQVINSKEVFNKWESMIKLFAACWNDFYLEVIADLSEYAECWCKWFDHLDHIVIVVFELQKTCIKFLQWLLVSNLWPVTTILPPGFHLILTHIYRSSNLSSHVFKLVGFTGFDQKREIRDLLQPILAELVTNKFSSYLCVVDRLVSNDNWTASHPPKVLTSSSYEDFVVLIYTLTDAMAHIMSFNDDLVPFITDKVLLMTQHFINLTYSTMYNDSLANVLCYTYSVTHNFIVSDAATAHQVTSKRHKKYKGLKSYVSMLTYHKRSKKYSRNKKPVVELDNDLALNAGIELLSDDSSDESDITPPATANNATDINLEGKNESLINDVLNGTATTGTTLKDNKTVLDYILHVQSSCSFSKTITQKSSTSRIQLDKDLQELVSTQFCTLYTPITSLDFGSIHSWISRMHNMYELEQLLQKLLAYISNLPARMCSLDDDQWATLNKLKSLLGSRSKLTDDSAVIEQPKNKHKLVSVIPNDTLIKKIKESCRELFNTAKHISSALFTLKVVYIDLLKPMIKQLYVPQISSGKNIKQVISMLPSTVDVTIQSLPSTYRDTVRENVLTELVNVWFLLVQERLSTDYKLSRDDLSVLLSDYQHLTDYVSSKNVHLQYLTDLYSSVSVYLNNLTYNQTAVDHNYLKSDNTPAFSADEILKSHSSKKKKEHKGVFNATIKKLHF